MGFHDCIKKAEKDNISSIFMVDKLEKNAIRALEFIPTSGLDGISGDSKKGLEYGLEHGLYTQDDIDRAQGSYEARKNQPLRY